MNQASHACKTLLIVLAFGAAFSGCERRAADQTGSKPLSSGEKSSGTSESSGAYGGGSVTKRAERAIDDSVITTKAKTALLADTTVKGSEIHVETEKGVVSLSGMVDSAQQRERAASIVRGIDGVKSVENKTTVKQ